MSGLERRLTRIEDKARTGQPLEDAHERDERLKLAREGAEHMNQARRREGMEPAFEITEGGVFCAYDRKPVTNFHQTLAEDWYHRQLELHDPDDEHGFTHDPEAEAFYRPDGEIALSRDTCHLERFFRYLS